MTKSNFADLLAKSSERAVVVAELSANHAGSLARAVKLLEEAVTAGASAVKLQTYSAASLTLESDREAFRLPLDSAWVSHKTLWDLYSEGSTPREWHAELFSVAKSLDIPLFSTPFSPSEVDFLSELDCPAYKIASPEIGYVQLLDSVAQSGKPVVISTGVAYESDIENAIVRLRNSGALDITVLKCTSSYPAPVAEQNLATMTDMARRWEVRVGFSDHTTSLSSGAVAVALGATVIEKHFSGNGRDGLDGFFSLTSSDFALYVDRIREAESLRGQVNYCITPSAQASRGAMRSIFFTKDLPRGHVLTLEDLAVVRPAGGLQPAEFDGVLGSRLNQSVDAATPVLRAQCEPHDS